MQKLTKKLSLVMVALFTVFTMLSYVPAKAATVVPQVQFAADQKTEFTAGERITFNLNAANYGGRVQYRVVLWNDATKSYSDLWNTADRYYANWMPYGNETLPLGWIINEPGTYRITVYVKRAGLANNKTATPAANCDSYQAGPAFVVKSAVSAESKTADYEKAPLTTVEEIAAAEALRAEAVALIAELTSETDKAALTAKVEAQDIKVTEAKYVHVKEVAGTNLNTIKVTFNKEVAANAKNYKIYEKDNEYVSLLVKSVTIDKEVATVTVYDTLVKDKTYVVEVTGATSADTKFAMKEMESKEFKYAIVAPATITFDSTKVLLTKALGFTIKDANGNDITANYSLSDLTIQVADTQYISATTLVANSVVGATIVNLKITDTEIQTGNTIIEFTAAAADKIASLGRYSLNDINYATPTTDLYRPANLTTDTVKLNFEVLKADGKAYLTPLLLEYIYSSSNPTVALVDADGMVTGLSEGTAYITVVATQKDGTTVVSRASKSFAVTVKADKKATSLKIDKNYVKVVKDSTISEAIKVTVLDQYGNTFKTAAGDVVVEFDKANIVTTSGSLAFVDGVATVTLNADATLGTAKATFAYGSLAKISAIVENVSPAAFNGYVAEIGAAKLDLYAGVDYSVGDNATAISVFQKDVNGNKIEVVNPGTGTNAFEVVKADTTKTAVTILGGAITAANEGTETLIVKVNGVTIASFTVTVVDSEPSLTKIVQTGDALDVTGTTVLATELVGTFVADAYTVKGLFVGYDQYGNEFAIAGTDYKVYSNNTSVISNTLVITPIANTATKVLLVVDVNGSFYQVEVLVR